MKTALIIDCDPGVDDAVALITTFFAPNIDIKLLCSNSGNLGIETTTKNLIHLTELYDQNIPVAKGAKNSLTKNASYTMGVHGEMGLGAYTYDKIYSSPIKLPAFEAMHTALQLYKNVTILVLGPATNVALLLKKYPNDIKNIKEIVIMGGSKNDVRIVKMPYPEFNINYDPKAIEIVLKSKANIVFIPMQFGHDTFIPKDDVNKLSSINKSGKLIKKMYQIYKDSHVGEKGAATHDSCAAMYVIEPTLFKLENVTAKILNINNKGILQTTLTSKPSKIKLAVDMNYNAFYNLYYGLLSIAKLKGE